MKIKYESDEENAFDIEESNFIQKLKRGQCKDKGNLPFKYLNFGGVRYFSTKCPYKGKYDNEDHEQKEKGDRNKKISKIFRRTKRRSYIYKENDNSSKDSEN